VRAALNTSLALGLWLALLPGIPGKSSAQSDEALEHDASTPADVLTYGMGYELQRYSPLDQIDVANVKRLVPVWNSSLSDNRGQENQPLVYEGLMYSGTHQSTFAFDARTGWLVWRSENRFAEEAYAVICCGVVNRGFALYEGMLFRTLLDAHVQALDARTGREIWKQQAGDHREGFSMTAAPLVAAGVVITGVSGGDYGISGYLDGWDPKTGKHLWRTHTVPAPGEAGSETWPEDDSWEHGGGATWITGSYDPKLGLVYWGVGNPAPLNPLQRPGDNLYTNSVLAVRPGTGEIVWHYQFSPNDPYDYDGVNELVLATLNVDGVARKVVMQANRNGFLYVLDRATGDLLRANPFANKINWADGIDLETGKPIFSALRRRNIEEGEQIEVWPGLIGAKNYAPMSYNPKTRLLYINAIEASMHYTPLGVMGWRRGTLFHGAELSFILPEGDVGYLRAVDPLTGRARWEVPMGAPNNGGTLSTAGDLVFTGDQLGRIIAFHAQTGAELWSYKTGSSVIAPPITYQLGGRQYLAVVSGVATAMSGAIPHRHFEHVTRGATLTVFRLFDATAPLPPSEPLTPVARPARNSIGSFHGTEKLTEEAEAGRLVYERVCATCHGHNLKTAGVAAQDLREFPIEESARFIRSVTQGAGDMPPFARVLSEAEIVSIFDYVRAMQTAEQ
jgi:alcohol dehydrogenase (cytochrome c)